MNKAIIITLLALLCPFFTIAQEEALTDYVEIEGHKLKISESPIFKKENDQYYALHEDKFYPVQVKERNTQGPVSLNIYITLDNGSEYSISGAFMDARRAQMEAEGRKVVKFGEYPDTKPFIRYTSPSTGKKYRFYDAKRTPDGRMISEEEFQSYRGNYKYIRRIDGGAFAMDTAIIQPPSEADIKAVEDHKKRFWAQVGAPAPEIKTTDLFGEEIDPETLKDKVVVVNFWFVSCPPCIREIPSLNRLTDQYKDRDDIVFLGLATDTEERLGKFLAHTQFKYQVVPKSLPIANEFLVNAYPSHFVIDKKGIIRQAWIGLNESTMDELSETVEEVLSEH